MPEEIIRPDFKRAEEQALRVLEDFGFGEPPIDPLRIAGDLGIKVHFAKFADQFENVSGFFDADENAIYVNSEESVRRQTFTLGHELGHYFLHREWLKSQDYRVLLRDDTEQKTEPKEREANAFAAQLLVPRFLLARYYKFATVQELSDLFMVSAPVIKNRLAFEFGA
jgi:Zn-dependent peptidase ImmA (M78 family)